MHLHMNLLARAPQKHRTCEGVKGLLSQVIQSKAFDKTTSYEEATLQLRVERKRESNLPRGASAA
jgi:hypothetical protein